MFIVEVIPGLYLSDLEAVNATTSSTAVDSIGEASLLLSIGCVSNRLPSDAMTILSFPQFNDEPNVYMLSLWKELSRCISHCLEVKGHKAVVHCVYGQSRSVSTILAYLLYSKHCACLTDAMTLLREKQPAWSINPGFLVQLAYLDEMLRCEHSSNLGNVHRLLTHQYRDYNITNSSSIKSYLERNQLDEESPSKKRKMIDFDDRIEEGVLRHIVCKQCKGLLTSSTDILQQSYDYSNFVQQYQDDFWRYYPTSKVSTVLPVKGQLAVPPLDWMLTQLQLPTNRIKDEVELTCPHCTQFTVGVWRRKCVNAIGAYLPCDLFALLQTATLIKRVAK